MKPNLTHTARSLTLIAGLLVSSSAAAQFVVDSVEEEEGVLIELHEDAEHRLEYIVHPEHVVHDEHKKVSNRWVKKIHDGEHEYVLKMENGNFEVIIDGKDIPASWINEDGDKVKVINDDGKSVYEFIVDKQANRRFGAVATNQIATGNQVFSWVSDEKDNGKVATKVMMEKPSVMLGINMSEPSEALRKHLRIDGDRKVIMVEKVMDGLPAQLAGMEDFDIILSINGSDEADGDILHKVLMKSNEGDALKLVILRAGDKIKLKPKLIAYNGEKLGNVEFAVNVETGNAAPGNTWFSDDGNVKIKVDRLAKETLDLAQRAELKEEMMMRAKEALAHAERQVLELRDGQLFVHEKQIEELHHNIAGLAERAHHEGLKELELLRGQSGDRMRMLEERLQHLETRLETQSENLEMRMEQLAGLLERVFDKLSREDDED